MVSLVSIGMFAQSYYMIPALDAGFNPGNLNNEAEQPAELGWADVMSTTTTPTWSAAQTIPFTFMFNGATESSYVVSNTGVVTFAAVPGTPPPATNAALPSGIIPEKSIMVWGIALTGANDKIRTKTLGTAPNRQHWISWTSASHPLLTGASNWTYWSIVLEETTNKIYIVDQRTYDGANNVALTAGLQISTTDYISIGNSPALQSRTTATSGNGSDPSDNTFYEMAYGTPPNGDVMAVEEKVSNIIAPNTPITVEGLFRNMGVTPISTADFNYSVNGGATVTSAVTSASIGSGEFKTISSPTQWTPTASGVYSIEMWLSNINGSADPNPANDKITGKVVVTANPPTRKVFIEERTGTWCGFCPRGAVAMEYMAMNHHDDAVLVAVHNNDPMAVTAYDNNMVGNFPTFTADRTFPDQGIGTGSVMEGAMNQRLAVIPAASLEITNVDYQSSGAVKVDVKSKFLVDGSDNDFRFVLVFKEDGVTGTSSQYNQVNYYAGGGRGPLPDAKGFDYATAPDPVPASQMVYHHVARAIEPSYSGAVGSVPATLTFEQEVTYSFNVNLPSTVINPNHVQVVALLLDNKKGGEVVNASEKKLTNVVSIPEVEALQANIFPNPASDFFNIELAETSDFSFELVNAIGQTVMTQSYTDANSATVSTENLAKGVYFLTLNSGDKSSTMRISITK